MIRTPRKITVAAVVLVLSATPLLAEGTSSENDTENTAESQAIQSVAITAAQAGDAATKAVPGKVYEVSFDSEKAGPVWNVTVAAQDGTETLVAIDAQSGKILSQGVAGQEGEQQGEDQGSNQDEGNEANN